MSDTSNINPEEINKTVAKLDGIVGSIRGCFNAFNEAIAALDKGWVSEVKGAFMENYRTDSAAIQEMLDQYAEVNEQLKNSAAEFEKAESDILREVSALH
ncbi:MAG: WXG100 family type VII secretion target [Oscillospiraceae bacterium]|jgi:WXG100 family type VII secretion target|nr:WXG100 family type VII secretion target [Oscillospiraceae bacterium]